jgi:hypothetical protein
MYIISYAQRKYIFLIGFNQELPCFFQSSLMTNLEMCHSEVRMHFCKNSNVTINCEGKYFKITWQNRIILWILLIKIMLIWRMEFLGMQTKFQKIQSNNNFLFKNNWKHGIPILTHLEQKPLPSWLNICAYHCFCGTMIAVLCGLMPVYWFFKSFGMI